MMARPLAEETSRPGQGRPGSYPWRLLRGSLEGYLAFLLLFLLLLTVTLSLEQARWVSEMPSLTPVLLLALVVGRALAPQPWPRNLHHILALGLGVGVTLFQVSRMSQGLSGLGNWLQAAASGGTSQGAVSFAVFLTALTWALGYLAAWLAFRGRSPWWAILFAGIILLVNLANLPEDFQVYFYVFLLASCILLAHRYISSRRQSWRQLRFSHPRLATPYLLAQALGIGMLAIALAWALPQVGPVANLTGAAQKPFHYLQDQFQRLFTSLTVKKPIHIIGEVGDTLAFGVEPFELGDRILFTVASDWRQKWRLRTFDIYTSRGWVSSPTIEVPLEEPPDISARARPLTATVTMNAYTLALVSAGQPLDFNLPALAQVRPDQTYLIDFKAEDPSASSGQAPSLPEDLADLARALRAEALQGSLPYARVLPLLPPDLAIVKLSFQGDEVSQIVVAPKELGDVTSVRKVGTRYLSPRQSYRVTSAIPLASAYDLRQAGASYPSWITEGYLQLPASLPPRVRDLAQEVTRGAATPYDKAAAIRDFLLTLPYRRDVSPPPPEADGVDYFLFTQKEGFCENFASAMVVLLRAAEVPARLVVGYTAGAFYSKSSAFVVKERNYHAWVDVYFPEYGWSEFDPTPVARSEDKEEEEGVPGGGGEESLDEDIAPAGGGRLIPWLSFSLRDYGIALALAAFLAWLWLFWPGASSQRTYPARVYARMCRLASLARMKPQPHQTPGEFSARLIRAFPLRASEIQRIAQAYLKDRYGQRKAMTPEERHEVEAAWRSLRPPLIRSIFRWSGAGDGG